MSLPLDLLLALSPLAVPSPLGGDLLGQGEFQGSTCSTASASSSADFVIRLAPEPTILALTIDENNAPQLIGRTFRIGPDAGAVFVQAVELLTNGVPTRITFSTDFSPGGGCSTTYLGEEFLFDFSGLACPNGVDFGGSSIERIEIFLEDVCFGSKPGHLQSALRVDLVVSVYGHDPAPCLPPRFYVRQQPVQASSSLRGELTGRSDRDLRWRLWVDHGTPVSGGVGDLLLVSCRPLELPLPAGQLLCDPSVDALILRETNLGVGQVVELPIPAGFRDPGALYAQALTIDDDGRFHLTNGLELNLSRE